MKTLYQIVRQNIAGFFTSIKQAMTRNTQFEIGYALGKAEGILEASRIHNENRINSIHNY